VHKIKNQFDPVTLAILEMNTQAESLGVGKNIDSLIVESELESAQKMFRIASRRYYPREFDVTCRVSDGSLRAMHFTACMLKLTDAREVMQVVAKDVTKERENERKIASYVGELETLNRRLEELSITDELTQLYNVRRFKELLEQEHTRAARYETSYSVIFIDIDHFKNFNDKAGHPAGDRLLRGLGGILKRQCRNTDHPARYGGEEFVVLCPEVDAEHAMVLAERIRVAVANEKFLSREVQPGGKVTISVGVASFPLAGATAQDIVKAADQALYASKHGGRNRVSCWTASSSL
jgi:diguanylate cyclase (GGDEF)-like protein